MRRSYGSGWYSATGWLLTMPHSVAQRRGVGGVGPGRDSQVRRGMDSPLTRVPACVSALNAPAGGAVSYGPLWAHYLGGYQDRLLGGPLGLPDLRCMAPAGVEHKDYRGEVLG
jgi:hypothetical protein